ncbi:hypothetical protein SAMN04488688_103443 [Paenibacillus sp. cl141a]|nr:hypothetical protein SAMN04488688_103443 [Paenibacillus sp. cl141a]
MKLYPFLMFHWFMIAIRTVFRTSANGVFLIVFGQCR